jgi:hypothetical protein
MQMPHVVHDLLDRTFSTGSGHLRFDSAQVGHGHHTGEKMTPDLAVCPVAEQARADQIDVLAATEPVLNLPAGKARFNDIARHPVRIVGNNDVFPEHRLFPVDQQLLAYGLKFFGKGVACLRADAGVWATMTVRSLPQLLRCNTPGFYRCIFRGIASLDTLAQLREQKE